jgi:hypothetical protein
VAAAHVTHSAKDRRRLNIVRTAGNGDRAGGAAAAHGANSDPKHGRNEARDRRAAESGNPRPEIDVTIHLAQYRAPPPGSWSLR